jgi:hypothetical protein
VEVDTEAIALALKQATAVALIANELLQNAGKHGATRARVFMKATGPVAQLRVIDNGPGFPPDFDVSRDANLGLSLVDTLARHDLRGNVLFANDSGARVEVTFPLEAAAELRPPSVWAAADGGDGLRRWGRPPSVGTGLRARTAGGDARATGASAGGDARATWRLRAGTPALPERLRAVGRASVPAATSGHPRSRLLKAVA